MPIIIDMPRLNDTMEEGTLAAWHVKVGDSLSAGDPICDIETDKATQELQAFEDGTVAKICVEPGATVNTGTAIVILAAPGESVEEASAIEIADSSAISPKEEAPAPAKSEMPIQPAPKPVGSVAAKEVSEQAAPVSAGGQEVHIKASPLALKLAVKHAVNIAAVAGTGPNGRVLKRDVLKAAENGTASIHAGAVSVKAKKIEPFALSKLESKSIPVSKMRKVIASRLVESKQQAPHFQVSVEIRADKLMEARAGANLQLEKSGVKISVNDMIVRATAIASAAHPAINSSWVGDEIVQHGTVNVGVAISLPEENGGGLVVATLRDVQDSNVSDISGSVKTLAKKARAKGLSLDEMSDSTITVSNLGMPQYGVVQFNPIINMPNAAILGVGAAIEKPVVENGELAVGKVMNITLSGDHRVIDGAQAAEFLSTLKVLIENPASLLV